MTFEVVQSQSFNIHSFHDRLRSGLCEEDQEKGGGEGGEDNEKFRVNEAIDRGWKED